MFRHIMVPVDLTPKNRAAVRMAARLAVPGRTRITLVHVIELIPGASFEELESFYSGLESKAERGMALLIMPLKRKRLAVRGDIVYGNRVTEIIRLAISRKADLLLMTSHRVNLSRQGQDWGTISHKVGILSQCPVLLVK